MKIEECQIYEIVKNSLPIGFTLVDKEGVIIDFNSQAEVITSGNPPWHNRQGSLSAFSICPPGKKADCGRRDKYKAKKR
jgi:hypothetical protein